MNCGDHNEFDIIDVIENNQTKASRHVNESDNVNRQRNLSNTIFSNLSSNYPLASNPNTPFQNMNYKEYLNITEGGIINPTLAGSAIVVAQNVSKTILKKLGSTILGKILGSVLDILWPTNTEEIWLELIDEVEELINQKIEQQVIIDAETALESVKLNVDLYLNALAEWETRPTNEYSTELVYKRFTDAYNYARTSMPFFSVRTYEVSLLSVYAQAANISLLLSRDAQIYGDLWGFDEHDKATFDGERKLFRAEYIDHCTKYYKVGLDRLKGSSYESWVNYNRYRREMTLMILDTIAAFPYYDIEEYPIEVSTQLAREVYTDPIITSFVESDHGPSFSFMESNAIRKPHLVDYLDNLYIYTSRFRTFSNEFQPDLNYWAAHKVKYKYSGDPTLHETPIYGNASNYESTGNYSFRGNSIYQTLSAPSAILTPNYIYYGIEQVEFYGNKGNVYYRGGNKYPLSVDSANQLPPDVEPITENYNHVLCHATAVPVKDGGTVPIFSWTHRSADYYNTIYPDKITQLPAVKSTPSPEVEGLKVQEGPGFTGGDLVVAKSSNQTIVRLKVTVDSPGTQKYRIRLKYAATSNFYLGAYAGSNGGNGIPGISTVPKTMNIEDPLSYTSFAYIDLPDSYTFSQKDEVIRFTINIYESGGAVYADKVEFIPVDADYDEGVQLEKAQKAVNALFTAGRNALQTDVTDYKVDQVSILVDCVSGELYPNEKRELQNLIKYAKRLSYSRNLLLDPTFDSINSSDENGWYGSNGIAIGSGNIVFKGNYLIFSGTNDEQYPTYLYQKIDESKLKEYTRYKLRGFIESSQDLEAYVIRYDAKHQTMDVSNNLFSDITPVNACGEPNRCAALPYLDENPRLECSSIQDGILSDSHSFSLHIDTGSIDFNENVGIWVLFKISTLEGYAKFGNLEVIEDGPVIGEALARVKRQETKWRNKLTQLRTETQAIYTRAKQAIDNLFTNEQDSHLKIGTTFASIVAARKIVQSIREAYMSWLSIVPGVNYPIFTELNERVQQAFQLYDVRNVVRNGRFQSGTSDWIVTSDVKVQEENGNNVLVLSNWDAQVLQCMTLYQDRGYILRVTARKEGLGEGYVTITDEEGNTDQLRFGGCEEIDASNSFVSTGYVTKELEFFPDTEKVRIEIGETEGIFQVGSVELFLMEDLC
uniref:Crystaline entomocidal protoxin n=1 Tax=Bacillus thuringiensis TaxID=1428 RepID=R4V3T3_BACTU|nr:DGI-11 [Bacillus thuringiensis]